MRGHLDFRGGAVRASSPSCNKLSELVQSTENSTILQAALTYADGGWPVLPVHFKDKRPLTANGFKDASIDSKKVSDWFSVGEAGVGVRTGPPANLLVIDIDPKNEKTCHEILRELESKIGKLPETLTVLTPRGGQHLYYKSTQPVPSRVALIEGVDIRCQDAYVVAPPSVGQNGRRYTFDVGMPSAPVALPLAVISALARSPRSTLPSKDLSGIKEGHRNVTLTSVIGHLFRRNVDAGIVRILMHAWAATFKPPLAKVEIDRTLESIAKRELKRREQMGVQNGKL